MSQQEILSLLQTYWYWILIAIAAIIILFKFVPRYKIAPPDTALIISGLLRRRYKVRTPEGGIVAKKFGYRIVRGGATFWLPAVERIDKLDMCLMQVDIKTSQPVPTKEYISVLVDAVANIKIGSDDLSIATAAEQLLHYDAEQIKALAKDVLEGNMREIIGQMTIADLVQNRDKFAQESIKAAMADMRNMGLEIINLTIQNFTDFDGVEEGSVLKMMAAKNEADKARDQRIAKAEADKQASVAEMQADIEIHEQDRIRHVQISAYEQEQHKAEEAAEIARREKEAAIKRKEVEIEREKLNVEIREKAIAERDKVIAEAEARKAADQARADAALYAAQKEAEAIRIKGEAEAEALRKKAEAMQLYGQAAMMEMVANKLPEIARAVSEPLSKTEKIILFGEGGATSMARDTAGTMLQTFEAVKNTVGVDIPKIIKDVSTGGLIGKADKEENA